jgi:hypothetical protein
MTTHPSISTPSINGAVVAYTCLASAMGLIQQARQLAPHLFPGEELDAVIDTLDSELLELQRLPHWQ